MVEVYFTPPYTNGGIEKASVNLVQFAKTAQLEPGASETVSFTIDKENFASYDSGCSKTANGGYVLEAGEYALSIRSDSHTVLDSVTFTVGSDVDYSADGRPSDSAVPTNPCRRLCQLCPGDGSSRTRNLCHGCGYSGPHYEKIRGLL